MLHTRISEELADDIRRLADDLRVPASNLVRNVLEEVFTMMESVSGDVGELFEDVLDEAQEARERVRRRSSRRRRRSSTEGADRGGRARRFDDWVDREIGDDEPGSSADAPSEPGGSASDDPADHVEPVGADVIGWQSMILNQPRRCVGCGTALPRGAEAFMGVTASGPSDTMVCRSCTGAGD